MFGCIWQLQRGWVPYWGNKAKKELADSKLRSQMRALFDKPALTRSILGKSAAASYLHVTTAVLENLTLDILQYAS